MIGYMQIEQDRAIVTKMYLSSSVNFRLECREESIGLGLYSLGNWVRDRNEKDEADAGDDFDFGGS